MRRKGPWSAEQTEAYLAQARVPARIACNGGSGFPVVASLWFAPIEGSLWCATQRSARLTALLAADDRCAFEVGEESPPYCGVRGQGTATLHPDRGAEILAQLVHRYLEDPESEFAQWLLSRTDEETAIEITPRSLLTWDFRERMGAAG